MRWIPKKNMWFMLHGKGKLMRFFQELFQFPKFFDCNNIHVYFPNLSKKEDNHYDVVITKTKQGETIMPEGKMKHVVDIRARVTDEKGRLTYAKDITLGAMDLEDVVKVQAAVAQIEAARCEEQLAEESK